MDSRIAAAEAVMQMDRYLRAELLKKDGVVQKKKLWENTFAKHQIDKRKGGGMFFLQDHIRAMVYSMLSAGVVWARVESGIDEATGQITQIDDLFHGYDVDYILSSSPRQFVDRIKEERLAGQYTEKQIIGLINTNIPKLIEIEQEYGKAGNVAQEKCIQQIPGQKYANFSMGFKHEIDSAVWYYPAYKVVYKYQDKQYECLVSGCVVGCVYETAAPADDFLNTISQQSETRKKELNQSKKKATKQILIAGVVVELIAILGIFYNLVKITAGEGGKVGVIVWLVIAVSAIVFSRIMFAKRRRIKSDILNVDNEKETTVQNRQDRKMKIVEILESTDQYIRICGIYRNGIE